MGDASTDHPNWLRAECTMVHIAAMLAWQLTFPYFAGSSLLWHPPNTIPEDIPKNLLKKFYRNNLARQKITSKNKNNLKKCYFYACFKGHFRMVLKITSENRKIIFEAKKIASKISKGFFSTALLVGIVFSSLISCPSRRANTKRSALISEESLVFHTNQWGFGAFSPLVGAERPFSALIRGEILTRVKVSIS